MVAQVPAMGAGSSGSLGNGHKRFDPTLRLEARRAGGVGCNSGMLSATLRSVVHVSATLLSAGWPAFGSPAPSPSQAEPPRIVRDVTLEVGEVWTASDLDIKPG